MQSPELRWDHVLLARCQGGQMRWGTTGYLVGGSLVSVDHVIFGKRPCCNSFRCQLFLPGFACSICGGVWKPIGIQGASIQLVLLVWKNHFKQNATGWIYKVLSQPISPAESLHSADRTPKGR